MKLNFYYRAGPAGDPSKVALFETRQIASADSSEEQRYQLYLADTLGFVAHNPKECDFLIALIESVNLGTDQNQTYYGDDVELLIYSNHVQVNILVNDDWTNQPEGRICAGHWKVALQAWKKFLSLPKSQNSVLTVELTV
jgi:hypothetical protein